MASGSAFGRSPSCFPVFSDEGDRAPSLAAGLPSPLHRRRPPRLDAPEIVRLFAARDADVAIWDAKKTVRLSPAIMHDRAGYTPYEGLSVTGWPQIVLSRGRIVVRDGALHVALGVERREGLVEHQHELVLARERVGEALDLRTA